jgi:hypothetical protein
MLTILYWLYYIENFKLTIWQVEVKIQVPVRMNINNFFGKSFLYKVITENLHPRLLMEISYGTSCLLEKW